MTRIKVKNLQTGQTGTISEQYFDPNKYQRLDGGSPIQTTTTPQPTGMGGGGGQDIMQQLMMAQMASKISGKQPSYSNIYDILSPTPTAAQEERSATERKGTGLLTDSDKLLSAWNQMGLTDRLTPFAGAFSPKRATYDSLKKTHALELINMMSGKQFSDRERQFVLSLYPKMIDNKEVASAKMGAMKQFLSRTIGYQPSTELPSSFMPE